MQSTPLVIIFGVWDLLHVGHIRILRRAASMGDLTVAVPDDQVVIEDKGRLPIIPFQQRIEMVEAVRWVSRVVSYHALEFVTTLDLVKPDIVVVGGDWGSLDRHTQALAWCGQHNARVVQLSRTEGISSSSIEATIRQRELIAHK